MTATASLITDTQTLISATSRFGHSIPVYDDGYGPLFISRDSMGINGIVRAQIWEDAYGICKDEFFPEASETMEEIVEEYGQDFMDDACFQEAFGFRPNGPNASDKLNHGIYAKDLNGDHLDVLTPALLAELEISLVIESNE